jgi:hypothetical protein
MSRTSKTSSALRTALGALLAGAAVLLPALSAPAGAVVPSFNSPSAMAVVGQGGEAVLWVTNAGDGSLVHVDAGTGAVLGTQTRSTVKIGSPDAIVSLGSHLFVAGPTGSISELSDSGSFLAKQSVSGCSGGHSMLATDAAGELVELCANGELSVLSVTSAGPQLERQIPPSTSGISRATALAVHERLAFITSVAPADGVVELDLHTGTMVAAVTNASSKSLRFAEPGGIATDGTDLWVTNADTSTMTELSSPSLAFVGYMRDQGNYAFWYPGPILATPDASSGATNLYVASVDGPSWSMATRVVSSSTQHFGFHWMWCNTNSTSDPSFNSYSFDNPSALALADHSFWVLNQSNNLLDQMHAGSGALINEIS